MKTLFFCAAFVLASGAAIAGPFGLEKGTSFAELNKRLKLKPETTGIYSTANPPRAHPDFDDYRMTFAPGVGLCRVIAFSPPVTTNVYGEEAKQKYSTLQSALIQKYGQPNHNFDELRHGSIWSDSKDWTMSLLKTERSLSTFWLSTDLPDSLQSIRLNTVALSTTKVMIVIAYEFDNIQQCTDWRKQQIDSSL